MRTIRRSVEISAPVEEVFEFMTQPENLPSIWPSMVEVKNVTRAPDGAHSFDWTYKMAGIKFRGHAATVDVERNRRTVVRNDKGIPSTFVWTFRPAGEGRASVTIVVEYAIPQKLLRALAEPLIAKLNEHEAETVLANLKARMEIGRAAAKAPVEEARILH